MTDVTEGRGGVGERAAVLFDTRKVSLGGVVTGLALPRLSDGTMPAGVVRTPFTEGFAAGWTRFQLATVHIDYSCNRAASEHRSAAIAEIAGLLGRRSQDRYAWSQDLVLLGDFNISAPDDATMDALTSEGWIIPKELQAIPENDVPSDKAYDQIALRIPQERRRRFETTGEIRIDYADEYLKARRRRS